MRLQVHQLDSIVAIDGPASVLTPLAQLLPVTSGRPATSHVEVRRGRLQGFDVLDAQGAHGAVDVAHALEHVLASINRSVLEQCRDLAFHAGVVARSGRAVAFPAASGAGKSSLAAACLQSCWEYVSDEALVLASDGTIRPYRKPLSLLSWTLERLGLGPAPAGREERPVSWRELKGPLPREPVHLAAVVALNRRPGPPTLEPLPRGTAARLLLEHSFNHYRDPQEAVARTAKAVRAATTWTLHYDDPVAATHVLSSLA